jgi:quercetin dioxygenase-like cupin family protein
MKLAHLTTAEDGGSRFVDMQIRVRDAVTDPWGNTVRRSENFPATGWSIMEMPAGLKMDWHASAQPSFIIVLSGTIQSETTDGETRSWGAGEMFFTDDRGSGHRTRTVDGPAKLLFLYPPPEVQPGG